MVAPSLTVDLAWWDYTLQAVLILILFAASVAVSASVAEDDYWDWRESWSE